MKKIFIFMFCIVLVMGMASAQGIRDQQNDGKPEKRNEQRRNIDPHAGNNRQNKDNRKGELKSLTIEGTLKLEKGLIAVESGDEVYFVPMLTRYIGFLEGLKEGERVSIEGYGHKKIILPKKVTLGEKSYDFIANIPDNKSRNGIGRNCYNFFPNHGNKQNRDNFVPRNDRFNLERGKRGNRPIPE